MMTTTTYTTDTITLPKEGRVVEVDPTNTTVPTDFTTVSLQTNLIDRTNLLPLSLIIRKLIVESDVISLDTEFTGLGLSPYDKDNKGSKGVGSNGNRVGMEKDVELRYEKYRRLVREYSLVSLGVTLFRKVKEVANTTTTTTTTTTASNSNNSGKGVKEEEEEGVDKSNLNKEGEEEVPKRKKKTRRGSKKKKPKLTEEEEAEREGEEKKTNLPDTTTTTSTPQKNFRYRTSNFSFLLNNQLDFKVSPSSLAFLVQNGFDFTTLLQKGIPYLPGSLGLSSDLKREEEEKKNNNTNKSQLQLDTDKYNLVLRGLMMEIWKSKAALVVHNGLLDMMFLYHSFYAELPPKLETFLADISDWGATGSGIFDTKCLAEYVSRETATYLSFLFNKSLREQAVLSSILKSQPTLDINPIEIDHLQSFSVITLPPIRMGSTYNPPDPVNNAIVTPSTTTTQEFLSKLDETTTPTTLLETFFCLPYMYHGFCSDHQYQSKLNGPSNNINSGNFGCTKSHDLRAFLNASLILASQHYARHGARGSHRPNLKPSPYLLESIYLEHPDFYSRVLNTANQLFVSPASTPSTTSLHQSNLYHSAQYDSFMTGYIFLHYLHHPNLAHRLDLHAPPSNSPSLPSRPTPTPGSLAALLGQLQSSSPSTTTTPPSLTLTSPDRANHYRNYLYLMGKPTPLLVAKSTFAHYSPTHRQLWHLEP